MKRLLGSFLLILLLAACQDRFTATVTRFQNLPPNPTGLTFAILPDAPQVGNLEFQHIADLVANELAIYGLKPVPPPNGPPPPDLVVFVRYGPGGARTQIIDYGPGWGPWWGLPPYDYYTVYTYYLEVSMFDGPAWRRNEHRMLFQGRAVTDTGIREFNVVAPYLVRALFDRFPGENGKTVKVVIPVNR